MAYATSVGTINSIDLPVLKYRDQRVITTEYLAGLYGTETANLRMNFMNNADRFEAGRHFFKLEGAELSKFKILSSDIDKHTRSLILWTERGAARHAKMLNTDQAWSVFDLLEDAYFNSVIRRDPSNHDRTASPRAGVGQLAHARSHPRRTGLRLPPAARCAGSAGRKPLRARLAHPVLAPPAQPDFRALAMAGDLVGAKQKNEVNQFDS